MLYSFGKKINFNVFFFIFVIFLNPSANAFSQYYRLDVNKDAFSTSVDQSSLNTELTSADRIFIQKGHFFTVGKDAQFGTTDDRRLRLYGINLAYSANFPEPTLARAIARRLRSLGFNAVRLHHMDSLSDDDPELAHSILTQGPFPTFNMKSVGRLKQFLQILKEEGIYANLNLYVFYKFRPGIDHVPALISGQPTLSAALPPASPVHIFHPQIIALQKQYAEKLIQLLGIGNDPMLAMVEIRNESSLASAWQAWSDGEWTNAMQGEYAEELTRQWNAWLIRKYGTLLAACERWKSCSTDALQPMLSPAMADELRTGAHRGFLTKVVDKIYSVLNQVFEWVGLSPIHREISAEHQKVIDFVHFIVDTDQHYLDELKNTVRAVTSPTLPITGTQMSFGGPLNFMSHRGMDYIDDHFYVDFYNFPKIQWDSNDWRIKDNSLTGSEMSTLVDLGRHRDLARPFVVSEFNQAYPNRQGVEMTPVVALLGVLQDWDALFQFDFANGDDWGILPSVFRLSGDWAKLAITGQSAKIFRSDWVSPLSAQSAVSLDQNALLLGGALRHREGRGMVMNTNAPWTAEGIFQSRLGTTLDLSGALASPESTKSPLLPQPLATASTQINYSEEEHRLVFSAPMFAGFVGKYAPGQRIEVGDFTLEPLDLTRGFATVMITALDTQPMANAKRLLISLPGHVMGSQPGAIPPRPKKLIPYENSSEWLTLEPDSVPSNKPSGLREAQGPVWMERVPLRVTFKTHASQLQVFPLSLNGQRLAALPISAVHKVSEGFEFSLQTETSPQSPWYEVAVSTGGDAK